LLYVAIPEKLVLFSLEQKINIENHGFFNGVTETEKMFLVAEGQ